MKFNFWKCQGNGNDFIIIDEWGGRQNISEEQIVGLCNRHFGIGADGLMRIGKSNNSNFEMLYYNADGKPASMCGNGGRCIAAFAFSRKYTTKTMIFEAYDGLHNATIEKEIISQKKYYISLEMSNVEKVEKEDKYYFLNTGSPHYVEFVENVAGLDVIGKGGNIRNSKRFAPNGTNVNFAEFNGNRLFVRTYERGVENETFSCGTGIIATAIAAYLETGKKDFSLHTPGGDFTVDFKKVKEMFTHIYLHGPAEIVFRGTIEI